MALSDFDTRIMKVVQATHHVVTYVSLLDII